MSFLKKLFAPKNQKTGIVFIIEDNATYSKTVEAFIKANFSEVKNVRIFPVGETCLPELDKNPDIIIVDYLLNSKYFDAESGLEIIKKIRSQSPNVSIVVLSSQQEIDVVTQLVKTYNCNYIKKDDQAFDKMKEMINTFYKS